MRLFVGIDIEESIRQRIISFVDEMRSLAPDVRWVNPESFHVTLKFLGETGKAEEIKGALSGIRASRIGIEFRGTGYFPAHKSGRVFWAGIHADENLISLQQAVERAVSPLGFEREKSAYQPHLTLARAGSGRSGKSHAGANNKFQQLQQKLSGLPSPEFGTMTAHEFCLYESKLSPSGAQYSKVERYALGS